MTHEPTTAATDKTPMSRVVVAASLGTVFEYYDFMLYGSLAAFFGVLFFPPGNSTAALLGSLATFGAGFAIRPLGALVFGRLGDRVGRKRTFLITITLMGISTAAMGLLPTFEQIGWGAPILLVTLRLVQGLALGGEFGGAAIYIAEHCPADRRGFYTSWIQTTGTMGLVASLMVVLICRAVLDDASFREWGWRIPFLISILLLGLSLYVRAKLGESPMFVQAKARGDLSAAPITESFLTSQHRRSVISAIVVAAAMALTWYTAQFYSLVFMQTALQFDFATASLLAGLAMLIGIPMFVGAGALSDRIGRKPVILAGMLLSTLVVIPAYRGLQAVGHPAMAASAATTAILVYAPPAEFSPFSTAAPDAATSVRDFFAKRGISYRNEPQLRQAPVVTGIGATEFQGYQPEGMLAALTQAGFPTTPSLRAVTNPLDLDREHWIMLALLLAMIAGAALTCGPGAALLAESFPTRIRYTSLSFPYHLTSAWFGGFMPLTATWLVARSGDIFAGLVYPVAVTATCFVLCLFLLRETRHLKMD
ncbi:MAG: MFS transporter [Proteobacteria bacterium]|nr:MFS transporter [Pseudomonadota bacterium]